MGDIYDDAIADRKRLLDVAEKNAKNKIVDALKEAKRLDK